MSKVRIISNGQNRGTQVIDCDTGKPLPGVQKVVVTITPAGAQAAITQLFEVVGMDIVADHDQTDVQAVRRKGQHHNKKEG